MPAKTLPDGTRISPRTGKPVKPSTKFTRVNKLPRRPLKIESPDQLQAVIDAYFKECDNHIIKRQHVTGKGDIIVIETPEPYTMAGLACALGISRETLNNYSNATNHPAMAAETAKLYVDIISHARGIIQRSNVTEAMTGCHDSRIAALNIASNFGYSSKSDLSVSGKDGKALEYTITIVDPKDKPR